MLWKVTRRRPAIRVLPIPYIYRNRRARQQNSLHVAEFEVRVHPSGRTRWSESLPVVVDGNNLLHAAQAIGDPNLLVGRSMLCDALGAWARRRRERVHVVFDGPAPPRALAQQIAHPDIQVSYSGAGVSADAVLNKVIESDSAPRRLVVVSSDREVAAAARRRRARDMRSDVFWRSVQRELARPEPVAREPDQKRRGLDPDATEAWLSEFGFANPDPSAPGRQTGRRSARRRCE